MTYPGTAVRPPRRRRGLRALLITVAVLVVLLVAADRIGDYVAESVAARTIRTSQHLSSDPTVDVAGFPFLTQLASGDFDQVSITADNVRVGDDAHKLNVAHMAVDLRDVQVARDFSSVHAVRANATATVSYPQLSHTLGIDVTYASDHRIKASKQITVLGHSITPTISVSPQIVNGGLRFADPSIDGAAQLGSAAAALLQHYFDLQIPFTKLPFDVHVQSVQVDRTGVVVLLTGADITYSRG